MRLAFLLFTVVSLFGQDRRPVAVVELFTSEACSSCPPADEMLDRLEQQGVSDVRVIALEEHIDYWNNTGWVDRFSSPLFHARQNDYGQFFHTDSIYTPQMVVNGNAEFVADHFSHAVAQIKKAAVSSQYGLRLQPQRTRDAAVWDLTVYVKNNRQGKPEPSDVYLAISETNLNTNVQRGENSGHTLRHGPVVRSFGVIGNLEARPFNEVGLKSTLKIPADWNLDHLNAVVFVQEHRSRQITAAASTSLKN
jgi:hypothetical protein